MVSFLTTQNAAKIKFSIESSALLYCIYLFKACWSPMHNKFEGERAPKNANFRSKFSKKCLKTPFLACFFFKNLPAAQKIWLKWGSL